VDRILLRGELTRDEGLRLSSYKDSVGLWTIGVGHLLGDEQRMLKLTHAEAMALLDADIHAAVRLAEVLFPQLYDYSEARQRALANMTFNLGGRLAQFVKFCAAVEAGLWEVAATEMMASKWAGQVGKRAERLRDMILQG